MIKSQSSILLLFLFLLLFATDLLAQKIYVYKENSGVIRITNKQPASKFKVKTYQSRGSFSRYSVSRDPYPSTRASINYKTFVKKPLEYKSIIDQASRKHGVHPALIKAVIHTESAFNPRAKSPKGAMGLMQLMPSNVKIYGVGNPYSPHENINAGTKLLSKLIRKYSGNVKLALAAYNAGEGAVKKYRGVPPYKETINYIKKVMSLRNKYA